MEYLRVSTLGDLLVQGAREHPDRDAFVVDDERRTYLQMHERVTSTAGSLRGLGVERGDAVAFFMPNCMAFLEVEMACAYLGAVGVPINARFRPEELRYVLPDSEAKVLLVCDLAGQQADHLLRVHEALPSLSQADTAEPRRPRDLDEAPSLEFVVDLGAETSGPVMGADMFVAAGVDIAAADVEQQRRAVRLRDVAMMFYTSGTTANPKGCVLTHEALVRTGVTTRQRFEYRDGEVMFDPLPMFHTASTQPMIATMDAGGTFVSMSHFEPGEALRTVAEEGATAMFNAFPAITEGILDHPDYDAEASLSGVRTVFTVAAPDHLRTMQERLPHSTLVNAFGMTEFAGSVTMVTPHEGPQERLDTQGLPLPGIEVQIRDTDGSVLPPAEMGEIVLRGPTQFEYYHRDPAKTQETTDQDGWWRSGDLGVLRADGRLEFRGRLKDMLKVGGENVAAIEIESHLQKHPAVKIAQVVGIPDTKYGEVPAAFIEMREGATAEATELIAHCEGSIAGFKVPRYVRFVHEWPMSSTKIQKHRLREDLEAELA